MSVPRRTKRRVAGDERGFTIVETMVAIAIMGVAFLGMAGVHAISSRAQSLGQNQGLARYVADQQLESVRGQAIGEIEAVPSTPVTVQGVAFNVVRAVEVVPMGRRVQATVTWTDRFGPRTLTLTTIVSQVTNP